MKLPRGRCILLLLLTYSLVQSFTITEKDYSALFAKHTGTIVVLDQYNEKYIVFNKARSTERMTPFSTFKIPNSLIALETGVISDVEKIYTWDTTKYPTEAWWPQQWKTQHSMRSAIKFSVVPFYRTIATQVGSVKMKEYVDKFAYGNADISSGLDNFWLNGSLRISAIEQVDFLKKFYDGSLGVSEKTTKLVKDILVFEKTEKSVLSGKTGGGTVDTDQKRALGWFVGYVEKGSKVYYFALNIEGQQGLSEILPYRIDVTKSVLKELKILE